MPLFRRPKVLSSRLALLCARIRDRSGKECCGRSFASLEKEFPSDKIHEALKRLLDRRYIVPKSRASAAVAAAYWASLGLPPEAAEKNLQKCRVRIRVDRCEGRKGTRDSPRAGWASASCKRSADLTVTLVNDYLEERLAEMNRQHCRIVRPGCWFNLPAFFPWWGRYSRPGKGACWACLADRMTRNREVKALLDRKQARCVAVSPLARQHARAKRHPAGGRRDRKSDRHRLSHRTARSCRQPRPAGLDHRQALRRGPPAMSGLRPEESTRSAPCAGPGRACRRRQAGHDQRRLPDAFRRGLRSRVSAST